MCGGVDQDSPGRVASVKRRGGRCGVLAGGREGGVKGRGQTHPVSFAGEFENTRKPLKDFFFL